MPYLTWLADACRETGYPVIEVPGWRSAGHGPMTAGHGVVGHWTAGPAQDKTASNTPSLAVVRDGRPGLDGPLCNVYTAFDGTLYVVAAGKAYHAGVSSWRGESDLNGLYLGNEVESPGGFVYTDAQLDVTPRLHAALLRRMARPAECSCAHFECAQPDGRKPDGPARNMPAFRMQVNRYLANPASIRKTQEDDVSVADVEQALKNVLHIDDLAVPKGQANNNQLAVLLVGASQQEFNANGQIKAALGQLQTALSAVEQDTSVTGDDEAAIRDCIDSAVTEIKAAIAALPQTPDGGF
jgi:hypothetical protein